MKKLVSILIFVLILSLAAGALAAPYTNQTYQYSIEAPEGESVYYYTAESSNMPEDILAIAQSKNPPVSFMTAAYADGKALVYSLDISAIPITTALSDAALTGITDLSLLSTDQFALLSQNKKSEYGADYTFDADENTTLAGKTALVLTGHLTETNGYTTKLYLLADNEQLFIITVLYKDDSANTYLDQVSAVLNTLQFASTPVALQSTAAPSVTPTPVPTPTAVSTIAPTPTPVPTNGFMGFIDELRQNITNSYYNDPYFPLYVIGGCILVALIIIVIVLIRANRRKDKQTYSENFEALEDQVLSRHSEEEPVENTQENVPPQDSQYDLSRYTRQPRGYDVGMHEQESGSIPAEPSRDVYTPPVPTRPTIAQNAYSRSSQLPQEPAQYSSEQNNVTVPEEIPSQKAVPLPSDPSRPKVGSRMDRHRNKK